MTLTEYEEMVLAELEAQFTGPSEPGLRWTRLVGPSGWLAAGVALLVAAHSGPLVITMSDLLGFAIDAIATVLSLAGYLLLLVCAFHLGFAVHDVRSSPMRHTDTGHPVTRARRSPGAAATPR